MKFTIQVLLKYNIDRNSKKNMYFCYSLFNKHLIKDLNVRYHARHENSKAYNIGFIQFPQGPHCMKTRQTTEM